MLVVATCRQRKCHSWYVSLTNDHTFSTRLIFWMISTKCYINCLRIYQSAVVREVIYKHTSDKETVTDVTNINLWYHGRRQEAWASWDCCNRRYPPQNHHLFSHNLLLSRPIILKFCTEHCRALCKISKQIDNRLECYGRIFARFQFKMSFGRIACIATAAWRLHSAKLSPSTQLHLHIMTHKTLLKIF